MTRQTKTKDELSEMIMAEIRKHPECKNVVGVAFTDPIHSIFGANWDASFVYDGNNNTPRKAWEIAREFQMQFDVVR